MKKFLVCLCLLFSVGIAYSSEQEQDLYKQNLKDKGYLYGCTPVNWSLIEPVRGGFNWAVMHGEVNIMDLEVKAGLEPTSCGKTLPSTAILYKQNESLDFLLKHGYNANQIYADHSLLTFAIYRKNLKAVETLINNGADVNLIAKGKHPLNSAIKKNDFEIVNALYKAGAKPNEKTKQLIEKSKNNEIKALFKNL